MSFNAKLINEAAKLSEAHKNKVCAVDCDNVYFKSFTLLFLNGILLNGSEYYDYCVHPYHDEDVGEFLDLNENGVKKYFANLKQNKEDLLKDLVWLDRD